MTKNTFDFETHTEQLNRLLKTTLDMCDHGIESGAVPEESLRLTVSARQKQVKALAASGMGYKKIAKQTGIPRSTVRGDLKKGAKPTPGRGRNPPPDKDSPKTTKGAANDWSKRDYGQSLTPWLNCVKDLIGSTQGIVNNELNDARKERMSSLLDELKREVIDVIERWLAGEEKPKARDKKFAELRVVK